MGEEITHVTGKQCPQMSCCSCKPRHFFGSRFYRGRLVLWRVTLPRTQTHQPNLAPGVTGTGAGHGHSHEKQQQVPSQEPGVTSPSAMAAVTNDPRFVCHRGTEELVTAGVAV